MKKIVCNIFVVTLFMLLITMSSCKMIENLTALNKEAERVEEVSQDELDDERESAEENYFDEDDIYSDYAVDSVVYEVAMDSLAYAAQDSLVSEDESDEMTEILDELDDMPFFEDGVSKFSSKSENIYNYPADFIPTFSDSVYKRRMEILNKRTTLNLTYNESVKGFIRAYAVSKRKSTARILGLADIYFPMIEETLSKYDMPLEIKYLAVVESALNPTAGSSVGAKGLWQFMLGTGREYNLNVTTLIDERYDPVKATDAACRYLTNLYNRYGDWYLALAAYNCGPGNVNKAINRAKAALRESNVSYEQRHLNNFWVIRRYLPQETRNYVPTFIAVNYIMNYSQEHNIYPTNPGIMAEGIDTVTVHDYLHFDQISEKLNIPMKELQFFNPQYIANIIPATVKNPLPLRLPEQYVESFIENEKSLYTYVTTSGMDRAKIDEMIKAVNSARIHVVKKNETLGSIAKKYKVSVKNIKAWNGLRSDNIYIGQKLKINGSSVPVNSGSSSSSTVNNTNQAPTTYIVKSGDNLSLIAKKFGCKVSDLRRWNNLKSDNLKPGQKLKLYSSSNSGSTSGSGSSSTSLAPSSTIHIVKSGENLTSIAKKYGVSVSDIRSCNGLKSDNLRVGQKLQICYPAGAVIHTVKSGENLTTIAKKYGVSVEQVKRLNSLTSRSILNVGQKLRIK